MIAPHPQRGQSRCRQPATFFGGLYSLLGPYGGGYNILIVAMIGGGLAGDFLWDRHFQNTDPDQSEQE